MLFATFKEHLFNAAQSANVDKFIELITSNLSFSDNLQLLTNKNGDTVVHLAARRGCVDIIKYCSSQCDSKILSQRNLDGKTPLHIAAHSSQLLCVEFLLSCKVPVDALKRSDWTPLMLACTKSELNIIKLLVSHRANPTLQNKDGWTAFHIASREGSISIIEYLLEHDPMLWKTQSKNGRTPLHTAALHGKIEVVKLLLNKTNHIVDPVDSCGTTPIMDAVSGNHNDVVKVLINAGALLKTDSLGRNLLHLSAQANNIECIRYLIEECKMDINSVSCDGLTALHFATKGNNLLCVETLLEMGADLSIKDIKGRTAMEFAVDENISARLQAAATNK